MNHIATLVKMPSLSFVIPVKDEEATLGGLFEKISAQASSLTACWEVIFVDDGSTDESWRTIRKLAAADAEHVRAIRFRRNVGKADALAAAWKEVRGDFVFTMDADLQDDPEEIPRFLEKIKEGFDVVTGWKRTRHDPWHKVLPSRVFNLLISHINRVHLHDHNCGFKCYRREVLQSIPMYGEMHRMVPSLAAMRGFRTAEIPIKHHPRRYGRSKYGFSRFLRGFLDMWTVHFLSNFRQRPMHLMGGISALMLGCGCVLAFFLARVALPLSVDLLLSSALPALLVGSVLTMMIGLMAEWNVHQSIEHAQQGTIAETIGLGSSASGLALSVEQSIPDKGSSRKLPTALIVDNDSTTHELTAAHLREAGWQVLTASSYAECHWKLDTSLDVLIVNVDLPDDSGLGLSGFVERVRKASPSAEIIFLPSETHEKANFETMQLGAFDYVCKPVEPAQLVSVALRALNQRRPSAFASGA
jgi:glycosyltransferase involved in cell wall biosynthesis/CheY-like chemotaxis protein